jgi:predicted RNA-binding Zn ribbon-like protein
MSGDWVLDSPYPSVNFLNTLRDRYLGGWELLTTPELLAEWLVAAKLTDRAPELTRARLAEAVALREAMDAVLMAVGRRERPSAKAVRVLNATAASAPRAVLQLRLPSKGLPEPCQVLPGNPAAAALATLAADAIQRVAERACVRQCAAEDCSIRYVDLSPARNKQWCSMARCGNRMKSRNHYRRVTAH